MEQNDIGFITVAICGGYISKYPRLFGHFPSLQKGGLLTNNLLMLTT